MLNTSRINLLKKPARDVCFAVTFCKSKICDSLACDFRNTAWIKDSLIKTKIVGQSLYYSVSGRDRT
jgi:hypothetical protein